MTDRVEANTYVGSEEEGEDAKAVLDLLDQQDDFVVARVRLMVIDHEFLESVGQECYVCEKSFEVGDSAYLWGVPIGENLEEIKASTVVVMRSHCSDDCLTEDIKQWADARNVGDYATGYYA